MKRPSVEALRTAALWVEHYEGCSTDGEREMPAVARWLDAQADAEEEARFVRVAIKETGCSRAFAIRKWRSLKA